jgi:hypothetical protein
MSDTLCEMEGCSLLAELFRARGYSIQRNVLFEEYGVSFHLDGWDPQARVGFEFLTSEDEDHDDLSLDEYKALNVQQQRGELSLFIIDEVEPLTASALLQEANEFLDEVKEAAQARRLAAVRRAKAQLARTPAAGKPPVAPKPVAKKKPAGGMPAVKKAAASKPLPRKGAAPKAAAKPAAAKKPAVKMGVVKKPVAKKAVAKPRAPKKGAAKTAIAIPARKPAGRPPVKKPAKKPGSQKRRG